MLSFPSSHSFPASLIKEMRSFFASEAYLTYSKETYDSHDDVGDVDKNRKGVKSRGADDSDEGNIIHSRRNYGIFN